MPLQTTRNCINIIFRRVRKVAKRHYVLCHVRPSVRTEQLGCHWKNFHETLHLSILRNSVDKIQVSLKCIKNNGYFTQRPINPQPPTYHMNRTVVLQPAKRTPPKTSRTKSSNTQRNEVCTLSNSHNKVHKKGTKYQTTNE